MSAHCDISKLELRLLKKIARAGRLNANLDFTPRMKKLIEADLLDLEIETRPEKKYPYCVKISKKGRQIIAMPLGV